MSGSNDGLPGAAMAVARLAGLVTVVLVVVRVAVWALALIFSVRCVLVQCRAHLQANAARPRL